MPSNIRCPKCDHSIAVADQSMGKKLRCKPCSTVFVVHGDVGIEVAPARPAGGSRSRSGDSRDRDAKNNPLAPPSKSKKGSGDGGGKWVLPVLLGGGGLVVVLCAGCFGGVWMLSSAMAPSTKVANVNKPPFNPVNPNPPPNPNPPNPNPPNPQPRPPDPQPPRAKFTPRVPWTVRPDPTTFQSPNNWSLTAELPAVLMGAVVFPNLDSPFVGLASSDRQFRDHLQVYDLRTFKAVGVPIKGRFGAAVSLSADGKYVAVGGDGRIDVSAVADGKVVRTFTLKPNARNVGLMDFPGDDRFISDAVEGGKGVRVFDLKTGRELAALEILSDEGFDWKWGALSPGGKYLAMQNTNDAAFSMHFWEVATGKLVGEFEMQPSDSLFGQASGVAFSPDGKMVSLLWQVNKGFWAKLFTWDVATVKKVSEHTLPSEAGPNTLASRCGHGTHRDLQWLPDGSGWMVASHQLLDLRTGTEVGRVCTLPSKIGPGPRKLLDGKHVATLVQKGTQVSFHIETFARGGKAPEPNPPEPKPGNPPEPPKDPNKFEAKVPWSVKPDPTLYKSDGKWDLKTELPTAFMGAVVFPYLDSPFVGLGSADPKLRDHLQVYDLRTMKPVGVPIKGGFGGVFAVSPDGKYVCSTGSGNIDVFTVADGKLQYTFEKGVNNVNLGVAEFAGNDLFLTETHDGASSNLKVWDLKTGKEVCKIDSPVEYFHWKWSGISPGGKYLVMQETSGRGTYTLHFWEIATGKLVGQQELQPKEDKWGQAQGIAFTPDGKSMSLTWRLAREPYWSKLWTWDVATGQKVSEHKIPNDQKKDTLCWHGTYRDLQWLHDGSGWMITSHFVLERETGQEVGRLGKEPSNIGGPTRKLLDANHIAIVTDGFKPALHVEAIPRKDIDAAMKKARDQQKPK